MFIIIPVDVSAPQSFSPLVVFLHSADRRRPSPAGSPPRALASHSSNRKSTSGPLDRTPPPATFVQCCGPIRQPRSLCLSDSCGIVNYSAAEDGLRVCTRVACHLLPPAGSWFIELIAADFVWVGTCTPPPPPDCVFLFANGGGDFDDVLKSEE